MVWGIVLHEVRRLKRHTVSSVFKHPVNDGRVEVGGTVETTLFRRTTHCSHPTDRNADGRHSSLPPSVQGEL